MGKRLKNTDPNKVGGLTLLIWSLGGSGLAVQALLMGSLMVYCTNALGLDSGLVGTLLMCSKIVDSLTDFVTGYIVDRTNTKLGKGRPWELAVIGVWFFTWMAFSAPATASVVVKCVWVVVAYILAQAIFLTLKQCAGTVYMVRAFNNEQKYVKLNSWGALISVLVVVIFNIIFPTFQAKVINDAAGWSQLVACFAVPLTVLALLPFCFIKEKYDVDVAQEEKTTLKDVVKLFKSNKFIYPVAVLLMATGISGNLSVSTYYFLYIVKNLEVMGILSVFSFFAMITLIFYPMILKKISVKQFIMGAMCISLVSGIIAYIAYDNIVLLAIAFIISGMVSLPCSYLSSLLIVECADYNEWQGRPRMEGSLTAVTNFSNQFGGALGTFVIGWLLAIAGFDGNLAVQPDSALSMIRLCYAFAPVFFNLLAAFALSFYKLDKLKPQMVKDLAERRALAEAKNTSK